MQISSDDFVCVPNNFLSVLPDGVTFESYVQVDSSVQTSGVITHAEIIESACPQVATSEDPSALSGEDSDDSNEGAYFPWKATAMGKNQMSGKAFLEKRYSEELELEDAVHTAILTLKEGFEGQMTADNIEVGLCDAAGFRRLSPGEVKDYLANIA
ncbi:hypothetical protein HPB52_005035 [Rhipicephalus sanguineus]|uniref:Uncharacterized protein n=1 Tax=Rhipicephalus sanguineus TaxID=34632 RepID=A0A9D4SVR7_RHISA|nr:hypothetical protein HPB52_005035 [Rhipicephalus sanguineus]